jgi:hypothetical protein
MSKIPRSPADRGDDKSKTGKDRPAATPARTGKDFGREGTNKTIPVPKPDGAPSEELGHTPHIEKSPYTRG